jgi:hypothetical protein
MRGKDYVEEDLFCDSLFDHYAGSELADDHGVMYFEDERASLSLVSGKEERRIWLSTSLQDNQHVEEYPNEDFDRSMEHPDRCNVGLEHSFLQEGPHSVHTNDIQGFLIMDFD